MQLSLIDWWVIIAFFVLVIGIGTWSYFKNTDTADYFVAGGKLPWWLSGISHHVSGYSGAVFVAYAGLAYTHGFSVYVWWALTIGVGMLPTVFILLGIVKRKQPVRKEVNELLQSLKKDTA